MLSICAAIALGILFCGCDDDDDSPAIGGEGGGGGGASITISVPNGSETYTQGDSVTIQWTSSNVNGTVDLSYTTDASAGTPTWTSIATAETNDGSYVWTLPTVESSDCKIRVAAGDASATDESDAVFSIVAPGTAAITVAQPNGGESYTQGGSVSIQWTSANVTGTVDLAYTTDASAGTPTWTDIATDEANDGSYDWTVPNAESSDCKVRVSASDASATDSSNAVFSIVAPSNPTITVTQPNGGESLPNGSTITVQWTSSDVSGTVDIAYTLNASAGTPIWADIATNEANDGSYDWTISASASADCKVRVVASDASASDLSDSVFEIVESGTTEITVESPNGGERILTQSATTIVWSSVGVAGTVDISYTTNASDASPSWTSIATNEVNDGSYAWTTPNTESTDCKVRVAASDASASDESDDVFELSTTGVIVTYPTDGDRFFGGATINIQWVDDGIVGAVDLAYTTNASDASPTWTTIQEDAPNSGSYQWTMPDTNSTDCKVRVIGFANGIGDVIGDSAGTFEIGDVGLVLTAPNGGELFFQNGATNITWISEGLTDTIELEYTSNDGADWTNIASGEADDGVYEWTIPAGVESTDCRVRVSAVSDGFSDMSDDVFEIDAVGTIYYVKSSGSGNGSSWAQAFGNPKDALAVATQGDQIWVAAGTYKPGTSNRDDSFTLVSGVGMYGGFAGTETELEDRDPKANRTILSGDLAGANSYHVIVADGVDNSVLDGFTVTLGYADGQFEDQSAAGAMISNSDFLIANCVFAENTADTTLGGTGGGMRIFYSSIEIDSCIFYDNRAPFGGAIAGSQNSVIVVRNTVFAENGAVGGGAVCSAFNNCDYTFTNCTFVNNTADNGSGGGDGGALWASTNCDSTMTNCIFSGNAAAGDGDHVALYESATNSVLNCYVEGSGGSGAGWDTSLGTDAGGNIDTTPINLVNAGDPDGADNTWATSDDGLALDTGSPCIDAGDNDSVELIPEDITGSTRVVGTAVDMGAYERQ